MNLADFKETLSKQVAKSVGFALPDGEPIPAQCHVTEVGLVTKKFVDCGGVVRETSACRLQLWEGDDREHRLTAGKLAHILELARSIVTPDSLDVEVEYEACSLSQYAVQRAEFAAGRVVFHLGSKHTDCLAREACGLPSSDHDSSRCSTQENEAAMSSCCSPGKGC